MALKYDFDIHFLVPKEITENPEYAEKIALLGINPAMSAKYFAQFRDPNTVEALRGAEKSVQDLFLNSGFGMNVYDSGAGPGRYPAADETYRNDILQKLSAKISDFPLEQASLNGFDFGQFLVSLASAKPVDSLEAPLAEASTPIAAPIGGAPKVAAPMMESALESVVGTSQDFQDLVKNSISAKPVKKSMIGPVPLLVAGGVLLVVTLSGILPF